MEELSGRDIRHLFDRLNAELARTGIVGEVYLVGGAVMCLVFDARPTTKDVDAFFRPAREVREAARRVNLDTDWLNDAVKEFLSERGGFHPCLELPNLRVLTAAPEYLLAMKCMAMHIGREFHDIEDVRFLLRYLNLTELDAALEIIGRYYPAERIPQKTIYALEEMFARTSPDPPTRSTDTIHRPNSQKDGRRQTGTRRNRPRRGKPQRRPMTSYVRTPESCHGVVCAGSKMLRSSGNSG